MIKLSQKFKSFSVLLIRNHRFSSETAKLKYNKSENNEITDMQQPLKFTDEKTWHAAYNIKRKQKDMPIYQSHIIKITVLISLIYFFYRKENELDRTFDKTHVIVKDNKSVKITIDD